MSNDNIIKVNCNELARYAEEKLRQRLKEQGSKCNESDFLAGVMTAWFYAKKQDKLPARWVFGTMFGGLSVNDYKLDDPKVIRFIEEET